jgi:hypothetical protein
MDTAQAIKNEDGFWRATFQERGVDLLFLSSMGIILLFFCWIILPGAIQGDAWGALLAGRWVFEHGLPYHDHFTVWAHGKAWIDQQWLSQLLMYLFWRVGGLGLVGILSMTALVGSLTTSIVVARRWGARVWSLFWTLLPCLWILILVSVVRTQLFAYPLFVGILVLLCADVRSPSRRVLWVLPLLVLWANLHGSVTMAVGVVVVRGLLLLVEDKGRMYKRAALLIGGAPVMLLLTPYGFSILSYYQHTLFNNALFTYDLEWWPVWLNLFALIPMVLISISGFWMLKDKRTLFEKLIFLILILGAVIAVRNVIWLALAAPILVAPSLPLRAPRPAPIRRALNTFLISLVGALILGSVIVIVSKPDPSLTTFYKTQLVRIIKEHATLRPILSDTEYADWLMWEDPSLQGHIAYDVRFELLSYAQLRSAALFGTASGRYWQRIACGYPLLVLTRLTSNIAIKDLVSEGYATVLWHDKEVYALQTTSKVCS